MSAAITPRWFLNLLQLLTLSDFELSVGLAVFFYQTLGDLVSLLSCSLKADKALVRLKPNECCPPENEEFTQGQSLWVVEFPCSKRLI